MRGGVKAYTKELRSKRKSTETGSELAVVALPEKQPGWPFLLGEKVDAAVQTIVKGVHDSGAVLNAAVAVGIAKGVLCKCDRSLLKENGGLLDPGKNWTKSLLYRMGFVKCRGNTKAKVSVEHFKELKIMNHWQ